MILFDVIASRHLSLFKYLEWPPFFKRFQRFWPLTNLTNFWRPRTSVQTIFLNWSKPLVAITATHAHTNKRFFIIPKWKDIARSFKYPKLRFPYRYTLFSCHSQILSQINYNNVWLFSLVDMRRSHARVPALHLHLRRCSQQTNSKFSLLPSIKSERVSGSVYFCAANLSRLCLRSDFDWRTNISSVLINDRHQNLLIGCLLLVS